MLTFLPLEEIEKMSSWQGSELNTAKDILAYELTSLVHGKEEAEKARKASLSLFGGGNGDEKEVPSYLLDKKELKDNKISIVDLLALSKLASSKSE